MKKGDFIKLHMDRCLGILSFLAFGFVVMLVFRFNYLSSGDHHALQGKGLLENPYRIENLSDYLLLSQDLSEADSLYKNAYIVLQADIVLSGENVKACLGNSDNGIFFNGTFDGNGHTISGLNITAADAALFPHLEGNVRNLNLVDCTFEGDKAAGIASTLTETGSIINCFVSVRAEGNKAAQLVSNDRGRIENCFCVGECAVFENNDDSRGAYTYLDDGNKVLAVTVSALKEETEVINRDDVCNRMNYNAKYLMPGENICSWKLRDGVCVLDLEGANLPRRIGIKISLSDVDRYIYAFFSWSDRRWYAALPAGCVGEAYDLEILTCKGEIQDRNVAVTDNRLEFSLGSEKTEVELLSFDDMSFIMMDFYDKDLNVRDFYPTKDYEAMGEAAVYESKGTRTGGSSDVVFSGRGNDSYKVKKRGFSMKLPGEYSLAGLPGHNEYNLIAGYRYDSLLTYVFTRDMYKELGLEYTHDYKMVNLYVGGEYMGLYFLTEKMEIGKNGFNIQDLQAETQRVNYGELFDYPLVEEDGEGREAGSVYYDIPNNPGDITGGYLLEVTMDDIKDYSSRFVTSGGTVYSSKNRYLTRDELYYIRDYVQDFEDAVCSENGYNKKGLCYADYIDMESFADQWILYEMAADISNVNSVYYFKDTNRNGDGKLHGVWPWDVERNFAMPGNENIHFLMRKVERGKKGDFWTYLMSHEDFREYISEEWNTKFLPVLNTKLVYGYKGGNIKTMEDYRNQYTDSYFINEKYWDEIDYRKKCDSLQNFLQKRVETMTEYFDGGY